jgi:quinoprotein glucose dehydrogenase
MIFTSSKGQNIGFLCLLAAMSLNSCKNSLSNKEWDVYAGGKDRQAYSPLNQIDTNNVKDLKVAWIYHTKDADNSSQIQTNPLIINGVLYGTSPQLKLFAADAATGKEKWIFDPVPSMLADNAGKQSYGLNVCRGIAIHKGENNEHRIFYTAGSSVYCINSATGKPLNSFGKDGNHVLLTSHDISI